MAKYKVGDKVLIGINASNDLNWLSIDFPASKYFDIFEIIDFKIDSPWRVRYFVDLTNKKLIKSRYYLDYSFIKTSNLNPKNLNKLSWYVLEGAIIKKMGCEKCNA